MAEETRELAAVHLRKLLAVTDAALSPLPLEWLLDELLVRIRDVLGSDTAAFLLLDDAGEELIARAAKGLEEEVERRAPPVVVSARQTDRHLRISVDDEGPGVPDDFRAQLFEQFTRGGSAAGSGLGLAIARSYALAHGGDLLYHQRAPAGARFELVLPQPAAAR